MLSLIRFTYLPTKNVHKPNHIGWAYLNTWEFHSIRPWNHSQLSFSSSVISKFFSLSRHTHDWKTTASPPNDDRPPQLCTEILCQLFSPWRWPSQQAELAGYCCPHHSQPTKVSDLPPSPWHLAVCGCIMAAVWYISLGWRPTQWHLSLACSPLMRPSMPTCYRRHPDGHLHCSATGTRWNIFTRFSGTDVLATLCCGSCWQSGDNCQWRVSPFHNGTCHWCFRS